MHIRYWSLILLACSLGCPSRPPSVPTVSTDTQNDLGHDHPHGHDDSNWHEHLHDRPVVGFHTHPHAHVHRHGQAPHQGVILSLELSDSSPEIERVPPTLHLEVVAELPERLSFYFFTETDDQFVPWSEVAEQAEVVLEIGEKADSLTLLRVAESEQYVGKLTADQRERFQATDTVLKFTITSLTIGQFVFEIPESLIYHNGKLDASLQ